MSEPTEESLRVQLAELNGRSRWYSTELWQVPFAYLGLTGLFIGQVVEKAPEYLSLAFIVSAIFGAFVSIHMRRLRNGEQRAVSYLKATESALKLPETAKEGHGPSLFEIALALTVAAYVVAAIYFLRSGHIDQHDKTLQHCGANHEQR